MRKVAQLNAALLELLLADADDAPLGGWAGEIASISAAQPGQTIRSMS